MLKFRIFPAAVLAAVLFCGPAVAQSGDADFSATRAAPRRVMTWVPPYATAASLTALKQKYSNEGPGRALTHLALQFWWPSTDGKHLQFSTDGTINAGVIRSFVRWAHAHDIKVLLCVYNAVPNWDWARAKKAFKGNRAKFVKALVNEVKKYDLDGIDIDFEGNDVATTGEFNGDKGAYVSFIKDLRSALPKARREVTVDSFPYIYNAPNSGWWASLLPHVDGLTSMGYAETGRNAADWAAYSWQRKHAGKHVAKLQIGLPSTLDTWQGNTAAEQVAWFPATTKVGVAIWDAQFTADAWHQKGLWRDLRRLRQGK